MKKIENLSGRLFGPYYVYALINPATKVPFYIGKGIANRVEAHFMNEMFVGMTPDQIFSLREDDKQEINKKTQKINALIKEGYKSTDIARVICRKVNEEAAYAIEACLIKSIYGLSNLTNVQDGKHSERFCEKDSSNSIPKLTPVEKNSIFSIKKVEEGESNYVYALVNPENKKIFYIGKGKGNRVSQHFDHAAKINLKSDPAERLNELKYLLDQDHRKENIAIILACVETEELAFLLETLYIKFVLGYKNLTNIQPGNCAFLIRAKDDWELRSGFDIQKIVEPGARRTELLDDFLGTGLDILLYECKDKLLADKDYSDLQFSNAKVAGAGELVIDANLDGQITLRIQVRQARTFQVLFVATSSQQKIWLVNHFRKMKAFPYKRKDFVFFPLAWRDTGVTKDINIAVQRAHYMIKLARAENRNDLPKDIEEELLGGLPFDRKIIHIEQKILNIL